MSRRRRRDDDDAVAAGLSRLPLEILQQPSLLGSLSCVDVARVARVDRAFGAAAARYAQPCRVATHTRRAIDDAVGRFACIYCALALVYFTDPRLLIVDARAPPADREVMRADDERVVAYIVRSSSSSSFYRDDRLHFEVKLAGAGAAHYMSVPERIYDDIDQLAPLWSVVCSMLLDNGGDGGGGATWRPSSRYSARLASLYRHAEPTGNPSLWLRAFAIEYGWVMTPSPRAWDPADYLYFSPPSQDVRVLILDNVRHVMWRAFEQLATSSMVPSELTRWNAVLRTDPNASVPLSWLVKGGGGTSSHGLAFDAGMALKLVLVGYLTDVRESLTTTTTLDDATDEEQQQQFTPAAMLDRADVVCEAIDFATTSVMDINLAWIDRALDQINVFRQWMSARALRDDDRLTSLSAHQTLDLYRTLSAERLAVE